MQHQTSVRSMTKTPVKKPATRNYLTPTSSSKARFGARIASRSSNKSSIGSAIINEIAYYEAGESEASQKPKPPVDEFEDVHVNFEHLEPANFQNSLT